MARAEGDRAALQRFIEDPTLRPGARRLVLPHTRAWLGQRDEARADTLNLAAQGVSLATRVFERIALAEAAARLVMPDLARSVLDLLEPLAGRAVCWFPFGVCEGAFDRLRADLFRVLGDPARAIALYESALSLELRLGAKPWAARTRLGLAEALASPGATQDLERATALRGEAMETFDSLAMELDLERASAFVVDPPRSALAPLRAQERPPPSRPSLILDGEVWTIAHEGERGLLPDLDGLRYLAWLIDHPDVPTAAAELLALSRRGPGTSVLESSVETPLFDQKARAAYRERVADLRATLDEAEAMNDRGRVARAQHELDQLLEELGRASGLGGRDRALGASTERARVNVTLRLRKAIARIREVCPLLGEHLEASVRTGSTCRYSPSPPAR
ncbi:MAG: hypothetical protein U0271_37100 [Polyangiaceae bacterium]